MTNDQLDKLQYHIAMHKRISYGEDGKSYYLIDNETIRFTDLSYTNNNCKFSINNDNSRFIWFSQLSHFFLTNDLNVVVSTITCNGINKRINDFKNGTEFFNQVKNKRFKVLISNNILGALDRFSKTANQLHLYNLADNYNKILEFINSNQINKIGDMIKSAQCYNLVEI